ncbi:chemotaxis protein CheB [Pedobacter sp. L105]|uniref:chemotaxis protein CheB n=1 Tax=Pedobacter sp. L105 TaxID=1641871 RepID=UPI00131D367A|nr:chemotaxis protein CheB [Pedobacter sp. L105]
MMEHDEAKNIITIGTSAGGIAAVSRLMATFNLDLDAAVFVVIHVSRMSMTEVILNTIQRHTVLKCVIPKDQQRIENKTIYLAPADHHMLIEKGTISITKGAYENHWRPSIDVLFRSAAASYNACVTGIILTGLLDDGTSGMHAIKRSGGLCIVQDPAEADFPDMPNSVIHQVDVDYKLSVNEMGYILTDLFTRGSCTEIEVPADIKLEAQIAKRMTSSLNDNLQLGEPTSLTCPDCGGVLVKVNQDIIPRYRCYTGHTFTGKILEEAQLNGIEDSLWVAIRMLEERKNLLLNMGKYELDANQGQSGSGKQKHAEEIQVHVDRLKGVLMELGTNNEASNN